MEQSCIFCDITSCSPLKVDLGWLQGFISPTVGLFITTAARTSNPEKYTETKERSLVRDLLHNSRSSKRANNKKKFVAMVTENLRSSFRDSIPRLQNMFIYRQRFWIHVSTAHDYLRHTNA
jgi:hypothetical protein